MKPSTRRVLDRLRQGPATTAQLCQPDVGGLRFGARLLELREVGFGVAEERLPLPTRGSRYTLTFDPEAQQARPVDDDAECAGIGLRPAGRPAAEVLTCPTDASPDQLPAAPAEPPAGLFDPDRLHQPCGFGESERAA